MRTFTLNNERARVAVVSHVMAAPLGFQVRISPPRRSLDQNAAQWPILQAFADQLLWPVNGELVSMSPEDWKDVLTAAFMREQRIAEGLTGGHVLIGSRTREFTKQQFSDWLEFLHSIAAERGVHIERETDGVSE